MNERRPPWFLLTGLLIGLGLGLLCSWVICAPSVRPGTPKQLRPDFKEYYRALVARAYAYDHNLPRARARLELLGAPANNIADTLRVQAQRALAEKHPQAEVRALSELAAALGEAPSPKKASPTPHKTQLPTATSTPTQKPKSTAAKKATATPTPTGFPTLAPTPTPLPTVTPRPTTVGGLFLLRSEKLLCDPKKGPLLEVWVKGSDGVGIPGVEIEVQWLGGDERIYTGLKPEIDPGYADFVMKPKVVYQVRTGAGAAVPNLTPMQCQDKHGRRYWGGWTLVFIKR